jgi:microcystin-dependent protein
MSSNPFVGQVMLVAGYYAPTGWLRCDGQVLPIIQYETLFQLIGTTYGGDGQDTFAVPDLRGSVPLHAGQGQGLTSRVLGESGGSETVTLHEGLLPAHSHPAFASNAAGTSAAPTGLLPARDASGSLHSAGGPNAALAPDAVQPVGGGQAHPNLQPTLAVTFCIAYEGIWPSPQ